jgi:hypothetical protein
LMVRMHDGHGIPKCSMALMVQTAMVHFVHIGEA